MAKSGFDFRRRGDLGRSLLSIFNSRRPPEFADFVKFAEFVDDKH